MSLQKLPEEIAYNNAVDEIGKKYGNQVKWLNFIYPVGDDFRERLESEIEADDAARIQALGRLMMSALEKHQNQNPWRIPVTHKAYPFWVGEDKESYTVRKIDRFQDTPRQWPKDILPKNSSEWATYPKTADGLRLAISYCDREAERECRELAARRWANRRSIIFILAVLAALFWLTKPGNLLSRDASYDEDPVVFYGGE